MNKNILPIFKISLIAIVLSIFMSRLTFNANAQMMMNSGESPSINPTNIQDQQQDEATGMKLFEQFQNSQVTCAKLTDTDFEKIGEYAMSQMFNGNTAQHVAMNERIKTMRGTTGEEQMHVQIGKSVTSCTSSSQNTSLRGGGFHMMGSGGYGMLNGNFAWFSPLAFVGWLVVLIDLILTGIWLWQQISKNKKK